MRGADVRFADVEQRVSGSSPRVRGGCLIEHGVDLAQRFIPACAGQMAVPWTRANTTPVHPRVRGADSRREHTQIDAHGSSPRARGGYFLTCGSTDR